MPRYHQLRDGEWTAVKRRGHKDACCDCGLVHRIEYRVAPDGRIELRAFRDDRATAAVRRRFAFVEAAAASRPANSGPHDQGDAPDSPSAHLRRTGRRQG
jgi:hypothetical protein